MDRLAAARSSWEISSAVKRSGRLSLTCNKPSVLPELRKGTSATDS